MSPFTATMQQRIQGSSSQVNKLVSVFDNPKMRVILIVSAVFFGLLYLWLVNSSATAGFELSDLEKNVVSLEQEYKKLEIEYAALHSLDHVEQVGEDMQLVASTNVEYVGDTGVASR